MKFFRSFALVIAALTTAMTGSGLAHADGASGGSNYYDGKDPAVTGCNVNASPIANRPIYDRYTGENVATIQIYYSWSCQANWFRVTGNRYGGNANKYIASDLGGWSNESDPGYGSSYTMMVYAPGATHIEGEVRLYEPGINEYNWMASGSFTL
ncbi:hypothetical protein BS329_17990 [Amycolatopsis coloradensis]|uniref:DUF2690 domain-containing protein n=1 Tax=Amycolatopsis coloradensis TaxID=76021 RepID=A0A1R0KT47_9PSEU|nr:hypothetical protein BS329_17990 [Amycolatopsis coloradensis]